MTRGHLGLGMFATVNPPRVGPACSVGTKDRLPDKTSERRLCADFKRARKQVVNRFKVAITVKLS